MQIYFADYRKGRARLDCLHACKARKGRANNNNNKQSKNGQRSRKVRESMKKASFKSAANSTLKIEMKSLRACLNVLKQAADDDKDGIRAYIAECGLTIGLVKRIKPVDIENYTQKSKSGSYCPWYVLGALKKAAANDLEGTIKTREAAETDAKKAAKSEKAAK